MKLSKYTVQSEESERSRKSTFHRFRPFTFEERSHFDVLDRQLSPTIVHFPSFGPSTLPRRTVHFHPRPSSFRFLTVHIHPRLSTFGRLDRPFYSVGPSILPRRTVHFTPSGRPLSPKTVHFIPSDRQLLLKNVYFHLDPYIA